MVCECEFVRDFKRSGSCLGTLPRQPRGDVDGIKADPDVDWSLDELFQELNSLYLKLISSSSSSKTKKKTRYGRRSGKPSRCFHMRVSDEDFEITDSDDDQENHDRMRFGCDDDNLYLRAQDLDSYLTTIRRYYELKSQIEERKIRSDAAFEEANRKEKTLQLDKLRQENAKAEAEELRDYDKRRVAEEAKFAALEAEKMAAKEAAEKEANDQRLILEATKKQTNAQQDKRIVALEAKFAALEAKFAALEAEKMAAKEAADKEANDHRLILEAAKKQTNAQKETSRIEQLPDDVLLIILPSLTILADRARTSILSRRWRNLWRSTFCHLFKAAKSSMKAENERLQKLQELCDMNNRLKMNSQQDFSSQERKIARLVRQITGTSDSVMKKSTEFINILNDHQCTHSISLAAFAEKIVSQNYCFALTAFAAGHVVVFVTSQVPHVMDIILAELNKACIYTVPKHISYSKSVFDSRESYLKFLGYRKVDGKLECREDFLIRVESCIKLYAALIQTQVDGIRNPHGLEAGWTWLATVLNNLPANIYTTVALATFLKMAGFALYKKYKAQFIKLLEVISEHFLKSLREQEEPGAGRYIASIESYIEHEAFLQEPEGWSLQGKLLSNERVPVA